MKLILLAAVLPVSLAAQTPTSIGGPQIGWTIDASAQLRPITGVPGAAALGAAIALPSDLTNPVLSPRQDYLVAIRDADSLPVLLKLPFNTGAVPATLDGALTPGRIEFSPSGSTALFLSPDSMHLQVITGLPDAPAIAWQADLSATPIAPAFLAVSDDGTAVLVDNPGATQDPVLLIASGAGPVVLYSAVQVAGLSFLNGRNDALIADAAANQVYLIRDVTGSAGLSLLADASAGVSSPVGVRASEDGATAFIANSNPGGVLAVDLGGNPALLLPCACTPAQMTRMGTAAFQLTGSSQAAIWIFQSAGTLQRLFFVPPDAPAAISGSGQ